MSLQDEHWSTVRILQGWVCAVLFLSWIDFNAACSEITWADRRYFIRPDVDLSEFQKCKKDSQALSDEFGNMFCMSHGVTHPDHLQNAMCADDGAVSPFSQSRHMVLPPDFEYNLNPYYGQPYGPIHGPYHKPYHGPFYPPYHRPIYGPYNGPSYGPFPNPNYGPVPHVDYSAPYGSPGFPPVPPFPVYGSEKDLITRNFLPPTVEELENAKKEKLKDLSNLTASTVISVTTTTTETTSIVGNGNIIAKEIKRAPPTKKSKKVS
ncbi:uncharacterized protein LOC111718061 [Eurytemora carolleeae]|uniref:uncharacterized protein LOC111718061 n=1 Tax=Eurytemora carolleeae TaxID=1294199 RepID=UPI000C77A63F|nr:uncharacterized protein LOC111718061 [Eurytemora carolleeae]|eukprot:XP_023349317.1 uncharacterized protein LOC111718061 [Eurytemora affinis]